MRFSEFSGRPNVNAAHAGPLTVGNTAVRLASLFTLHPNTEFVQIKVETAPIRICVNPSDPTSTAGMSYPVDSELILSKATAETARVIRNSADTDAAIQVAQYTA